jgi:hypothetical protein
MQNLVDHIGTEPEDGKRKNKRKAEIDRGE